MKKIGRVTLLVLLMCGLAAAVYGADTKKETLTFLTWIDITQDNVRSTVYKEAVAKFEKEHPNFKIEWRTLPWDEVITQIAVMHEAGATPDIMGMGQVGMRAQIDAGRALDLTPYYQKNPGLADEFKSANLRVATVNGHYYCIPHLTDLTVVYYRKDFFKEVGLDPSRGPATWDEFVQYAQKLTNKNRWGAAFTADLSGWLPQHWAPLVEMAGGKLIDEKGRSVMNNPGTIKALQFYVDLVQKYKVSPVEVIGLSPEAMSEGFIQGKFAMTLNDGSWNYAETYLPALGADKIGWSLYPAPQSGVKRVDHSSGWSFMIFAKSKHPDEALDFVLTMNSSENLHRLAVAGYGLPIRKGGIDALQTENPLMYQWGLEARNSVPVPPTPFVQELWQIVATNMEKAIQGKMTAAQALQATDADFNKKHNF